MNKRQIELWWKFQLCTESFSWNKSKLQWTSGASIDDVPCKQGILKWRKRFREQTNRALYWHKQTELVIDCCELRLGVFNLENRLFHHRVLLSFFVCPKIVNFYSFGLLCQTHPRLEVCLTKRNKLF